MTKMQAYDYLRAHGAGFIANVVLCQHANAARKLKALAALVAAGHHVALGSFAIDRLVIDGAEAPWSTLTGGASEWRDQINRLRTDARLRELENANLRAAVALMDRGAPCERCEDRDIADDIDANS